MDRYFLGTIRVRQTRNWAQKANDELEKKGLCATNVIAIIQRLGDMEIVYRYLPDFNYGGKNEKNQSI